MADLPFVDTHIHFWDLKDPKLRYSWLDRDFVHPALGNIDGIKSLLYGPEEFEAESRFANVPKAIHVQAAIGIEDPVDETRWLQAHADRTGIPQGIVAYADLGSPEAERLIAEHAEHANVRGIRDLRYDDYLTDEAWLRGYALLERHGLVACDDPLVEHMSAAAEVARRFSGITLCVDHAGFPKARNDEYFRTWRAGMRELAQVPNTVVKISGLGMADPRWTVESLRPWVLACIEEWGTERAFFGTNWPVDRLFSSYPDVIDAYVELISGFSRDEQEALFSKNAERIFRI